MKNYDSHVYLYAKGWYRRTDIVSDLKIIYGLRNGIDPEYITINDIISCLSKLSFKHMKLNEYGFLDFISDISPHAFRRTFYKEPYDFNVAVIEKCLSILALSTIDEIGQIDDADETVLPLRN